MKVRYSAEATSYYGEVARGLVDLPRRFAPTCSRT